MVDILTCTTKWNAGCKKNVNIVRLTFNFNPSWTMSGSFLFRRPCNSKIALVVENADSPSSDQNQG